MLKEDLEDDEPIVYPVLLCLSTLGDEAPGRHKDFSTVMPLPS